MPLTKHEAINKCKTCEASQGNCRPISPQYKWCSRLGIDRSQEIAALSLIG